MISAALVERNDVGAQAGFLFAFLFNRSDDGIARTGSLVARHSWFDRGVYPRSYIFNRHQNIELEIAGTIRKTNSAFQG